MHNIQFLDLERCSRVMRAEITAAIADVLDTGRFILGERVGMFEKAFAGYCGAAHGVGVGSGTDALRLALLACEVGQGHEVITVSNTCVPTVAAISSVGATPVFVDADPITYTMNPALLESRITARTRAILPVHLYGQCADMDSIIDLARRYRLRLIEDCAHAHGARYHGRMAGTMGDAGCYSFYPTKNLGALGDAGMVITNESEIAERVRLLRNHGQTHRDTYTIKGHNSRLDELQAAILLVKLQYLDRWNDRRRAIARMYSEGLSNTNIVCPVEASERHHVYHLYVVRVRDRERFQARMAEQGIATVVHYPVPVHRQAAYAELATQDDHLSITTALASEIVSLPLYPELEDHEIKAVITTIRELA